MSAFELLLVTHRGTWSRLQCHMAGFVADTGQCRSGSQARIRRVASGGRNRGRGSMSLLSRGTSEVTCEMNVCLLQRIRHGRGQREMSVSRMPTWYSTHGARFLSSGSYCGRKFASRYSQSGACWSLLYRTRSTTRFGVSWSYCSWRESK